MHSDITNAMPSKLLIVDSEHRTSGDSPNRFSVSFRNANLTNIKAVSLVTARTINSQYNVSETNNTIDYQYNSVSKSITIPIGQYAVNDFITAVNGLQTDFTLALDPMLLKFTWTSAGLPLTVFPTDSDELLGITSDLVDLVGGVTMTSQNLPDLSGLSIIHVSSNKLGHSNSVLSDQTNGNILSSIPVDDQFGFPIVYRAQTIDGSDNHEFQVAQDLNVVDIELLDHNYKPARLQSEIHLVFKVFY